MLPDDPKARVAWTYSAASDLYDDAALSFWDRFGRRTIERIGLAPGSRVLDACCGTGASALPAARAAGPSGSVLGVDLSEAMIARARAKAQALGLRNVEFRAADVDRLEPPEGGFDAVVCVFGIFFLPDMAAGTRALWRCVRPGGVLAVTTWGRGVFEPADSAFWDAVREERPDLCRAFSPWDRIADAASLRALLREAGIEAFADHETSEHPLRSPGDFWRIVMGSGYRATVEQLDEAGRSRVRSRVESFLESGGVTALRADVVYGSARKTGA